MRPGLDSASARAGRPAALPGPPGSPACAKQWRSGAVDFAAALSAPGFILITLRLPSLGWLTLRGPARIAWIAEPAQSLCYCGRHSARSIQ